VRFGGNPKQELQHLCQRKWGVPPIYAPIESRGQSHARAFLVSAEVDGRRFPGAWGRTLKEAERWAAYEALLVFAHEGDAEEAPSFGGGL
jgi:dsRNA-specific ribonuclease